MVEIGSGYKPGGILIVGRDFGEHEERLGRPFIGPAGKLLDECMNAAGMRRENVAITNVVSKRPERNVFRSHSSVDVGFGLRELDDTILRLGPCIVIALGNEASYACCAEGSWPSTTGDIFGATGITERRGYLWEGRHGVKVFTTLHPSGILHQGSEDVQARGAGAAIQKMLLTYDLERAREQAAVVGLQRPKRDVEVVSTAGGAACVAREIVGSARIGADIEIADARTLACVGFAPTSERAYVFVGDALSEAFRLLSLPSLTTVWHNAPFDLYFLLTRCGMRVANRLEDTMIGFHCNWPQLAGADPVRKSKRSQKSLRFLASLYTWDAWWKDYDFESEDEQYALNGRDCCVTLDVAARIAEDRQKQDTEAVYRHELRLIWPVVMMRARGLLVDEGGRQTRLRELDIRLDRENEAVGVLAGPLLAQGRAKISNSKLFWRQAVCSCCRGAKKKSQACWTCAGFDRAPSRKELEGVLQRKQ